LTLFSRSVSRTASRKVPKTVLKTLMTQPERMRHASPVDIVARFEFTPVFFAQGILIDRAGPGRDGVEPIERLSGPLHRGAQLFGDEFELIALQRAHCLELGGEAHIFAGRKACVACTLRDRALLAGRHEHDDALRAGL